MTRHQPPADHPEDDGPPIMGTWNRLYILVMVLHIVFIFFFYLITRSLS